MTSDARPMVSHRECVTALKKAYAALIEIKKYNKLHHDLDGYLFGIAEWGLGERNEKPDPENYGIKEK